MRHREAAQQLQQADGFAPGELPPALLALFPHLRGGGRPSPAELVELQRALEGRLAPASGEQQINLHAMSHLPPELRDALTAEFKTRCGGGDEPTDEELHAVATNIFHEVEDAIKMTKQLKEDADADGSGAGASAFGAEAAFLDAPPPGVSGWKKTKKVSFVMKGADARARGRQEEEARRRGRSDADDGRLQLHRRGRRRDGARRGNGAAAAHAHGLEEARLAAG